MATKTQAQVVSITAPNFQQVNVEIIGTAPYVQLKFSEKTKNAMMEKHRAGSQAKKGSKKEPRDFEDEYTRCTHLSSDGWIGIPAASFRNSMISACKLVGFHMTKGKLGIFIDSDGIDADEGTPLVKIIGKPEQSVLPVRNATGVADIRVRAMWRKWSASLTIRYDADMFSSTDIANLLSRAGMQVGIGEGRPDSKNSCGMGWGTFKINS